MPSKHRVEQKRPGGCTRPSHKVEQKRLVAVVGHPIGWKRRGWVALLGYPNRGWNRCKPFSILLSLILVCKAQAISL